LPGGARTTVLGFGCSALIGGRSRREARHLLDTAFDCGIRHYDVARVYGTGDAESVVGEFAAGRRDSLTIASKFGIDPAAGRVTSGVGKPLVRLVTRRSRRVLALARRRGGRTVKRGMFDPEKARASLETSLAQLGTDRLDAYLLHDCTAADWRRPDLQEALQLLQVEGSIGCFGPATAAAEVATILSSALAALPRIAQFGIGGAGRELLARADDSTFLISHGHYREGLEPLGSVLGDQATAARWSAAIDANVGSNEVLADLVLSSALRRNRGGVVLFSSGSRERIRRSAACAATEIYEPAQLDRFDTLVGDVLARRSPAGARS
jgi:hypothetical protein